MDKDKLNNTYYLELKRANVVLGSGGSEIVPTWGIIVGDIKQQKDLQDELSQIKESIPASYDEDINHLKEEKADKADTYTKKEVDDKIAGSGSVDLTDYYTKQEIEGKGYLTTETDPTVPIGLNSQINRYIQLTKLEHFLILLRFLILLDWLQRLK